MTVAHGLDGLTALAGHRLGPSSWLDVPQDRAEQFAEATGDPGRALFALTLTPVVLTEMLEVRGFSLVVNYGCDRVSFPAPVPVGSRVRASAVIDDVREIGGGVQAAVTLTFETAPAADPAAADPAAADPATEPACVAAILIRYYA